MNNRVNEPASTTAFHPIASARRAECKALQRRVLELCAGIALVSFGLAKGGLLGGAAGVAGGGLLIRALSWGSKPMARSNGADEHFGEGTRDKVDEASWESFPASDPPGH